MAQLLSVGALIVSQRSHPQDELEYESLVDFVDDEQFWPFVAQLAARAPEDRRHLGAERQERFARRSRVAPRSCTLGDRGARR